MLKIYLSSVVIWFIILFCELLLFKDFIYKNGWADINSDRKHNLFRLIIGWLMCAAVPVIRFVMAIIIFIMAGISKERANQIIEEAKDTNKED